MNESQFLKIIAALGDALEQKDDGLAYLKSQLRKLFLLGRVSEPLP